MTVVEAMGAQCVYWCRMAGQVVSVTAPGRAIQGPGDAVSLLIDGAAVSVFDGAGDERL